MCQIIHNSITKQSGILGISNERELLALCVTDSYLVIKIDVERLFVGLFPVGVASSFDLLEVAVLCTVLINNGVGS